MKWEKIDNMKKTLASLLVVALCLSLTACGGKESEEPKAPDNEPEIIKTALKSTVSTDTVDFTLENCQFTYYVSNNSATYVEPTDKANTFFASKKGTCYVSMTVTITNTDRGGSLSFAGSFNSWNPAEWNVKYKGETYDMYGFDLNIDKPQSISLTYAALVNKETGKVIKKIDSRNKLISVGETVTIRLFGIVPMEPENLTDGFDLEIKVPSSDGYKPFTYEIPTKAYP